MTHAVDRVEPISTDTELRIWADCSTSWVRIRFFDGLLTDSESADPGELAGC